MSTNLPVTVSRDGPIVHVYLNRPETMNVIDQPMATSLADCFSRLHHEKGIKAITLRGAGKHFMAGGDLGVLNTTPARRLEILDALIADFHRAIRAIRSVPVPIIAGVQGAAAGAGFSLALACDFIIADENARFIPAYSRIGATPDGGLSWFLFKTVGRLRAYEILTLGDAIEASVAKQLDIINRVVPGRELERLVNEFANQLAEGSIGSSAAIKTLLADAEFPQFDRHLDRELEFYRKAIVSDDFEIGMRAFFSGEKPRFT